MLRGAPEPLPGRLLKIDLLNGKWFAELLQDRRSHLHSTIRVQSGDLFQAGRRPFLTSYIARSASASAASALGVRASIRALPTLTRHGRFSPPGSRRPGRNAPSGRPLWRRSAVGRLLSEQHELVSAQPGRNMVERIRLRSSSATSRSIPSPTPWPWPSFVCLNPSRSAASARPSCGRPAIPSVPRRERSGAPGGWRGRSGDPGDLCPQVNLQLLRSEMLVVWATT